MRKGDAFLDMRRERRVAGGQKGRPVEILRTSGIEKRFRGVHALRGVDFSIEAGEIHALMGENGAGKSTLIKIITGVYRPTAGTVWLQGRQVAFASPLEA